MGRINVTAAASVIAGLLSYTNPTYAEDAYTLAQPCLALQTNHERLACYDRVAKRLGLNAVAGKISGDPGNWNIRSWKSPIDDSMNVVATLMADETIPGTLNFQKVTPSLSIRCKEGTMDSFITWERFISTQPTEQIIRFDSSKAYTQEWSISTDHEALFTYRTEIGEFMANLMMAKSLYVQVTPYGESPVGVHFYLKGSNVALLNIFQACS